MAELSRETGINDLGKTESYVRELISEKLLKQADLRNDMTILKLTFHGSRMVETFLPNYPKWNPRLFIWLGFAMVIIAIVSSLTQYSTNQVLAIFSGLINAGLGASMFVFGIYTIGGRKEMLRLEDEASLSA